MKVQQRFHGRAIANTTAVATTSAIFSIVDVWSSKPYWMLRTLFILLCCCAAVWIMSERRGSLVHEDELHQDDAWMQQHRATRKLID